ncbi:MAG: dihydrolipoyl dehydrogenase [Chloroflexi bacterium]|nr:dihydrolipoyl dehydrogenase [Chloroflexota bacterium]
MSTELYDIVIIGGGPGGYVAAIRAAQLHVRVGLVEKDLLGGACLNRGCIPTKTLVESVELFERTREAGEFGVDVSSYTANFAQMMKRKDEVVRSLRAGVEALMKAHRIEVFKGTGTILKPGLVRVAEAAGIGTEPGRRELRCKNIVIATGSQPAVLPIPGTKLPGVITSTEALELTAIPRSMVVVGGGVTAVEFIRILRPLGTEMQIVKRTPKILPPVDEEIARRYAQMLRAAGVEINAGARVREIVSAGAGVRLVFDTDQGERSLEGEYLLMATGNEPYTQGVGLENVGIAMKKDGIAVDEYLQTNVPGIYAIGDVTGGHMLAHVASYQGEIAVENAVGRRRKADYRSVPNCVFSSPEIAAVGLTEDEASAAGIPYKVSRFPWSASSRALTLGKTAGLVKYICEQETGRVLGMHIMGPHASDIIAEGALAIKMGATAMDIAETIHAHPTLPEAIREAALGQLEGAIHYRRL